VAGLRGGGSQISDAIGARGRGHANGRMDQIAVQLLDGPMLDVESARRESALRRRDGMPGARPGAACGVARHESRHGGHDGTNLTLDLKSWLKAYGGGGGEEEDEELEAMARRGIAEGRGRGAGDGVEKKRRAISLSPKNARADRVSQSALARSKGKKEVTSAGPAEVLVYPQRLCRPAWWGMHARSRQPAGMGVPICMAETGLQALPA
jgi:hypothetical protein